MVAPPDEAQSWQLSAPTTALRIALIAGSGSTHTGVGRYVQMLQHGLGVAGVKTQQIAPAPPPLPNPVYAALRRAGIDLRTFLTSYPLYMRYPPADRYHFTSQNLALLLCLRKPPARTLVTVHDIIPYLTRKDARLCTYRNTVHRFCDHLAMLGLRRADHLIMDSQYTQQCVVTQLGIPAERTSVVYLGIDQQRFRPCMVPYTLLERYQLPANRRYLIYVGSEDPRKNLETLLHALAELRRDMPDLALIKVGRAHFEHERQRLNALASDLGISAAIHFLADVAEADLPLLYNLAKVCVLPSWYEGFGFPVLEAMACGTPVVCARASSLPELVGTAALLFDPASAADLSAMLRLVLQHPTLAADLRARGLGRAAAFTWETTAQQVGAIYAQL